MSVHPVLVVQTMSNILTYAKQSQSRSISTLYPTAYHPASTTEAHLNTLQHKSAKLWAEIFPCNPVRYQALESRLTLRSNSDAHSKNIIRTATVLAALNSAETARVKAIVVFTATGDFACLISKGASSTQLNQSPWSLPADYCEHHR
jgi:pyruvate kinase